MGKKSHIPAMMVVFTTCFFLFVCAIAAASEISDLSAQKDEMSKTLFVTLDEYTNACAHYQSAVDARTQAESDLLTINERISVLRNDLTIRAASMYRQGPFKTLDMLLGSTSFLEFTTTWDMLKIINEQHAARIDEMRSLKEQQSELLTIYSENEKASAQLMRDIDEQTTQLNQQIAQLDSSIDALKKTAAVAEVARAEETKKIAEAVVNDRPTPQYPIPSYLGDGAWDATILELLEKYGLGESWLTPIRNIIWRESSNNPNASAGYYVGLCQFGEHWDAPKGWSGQGDWRYDPYASIERMVQYIADTGGLGSHWAATDY